MRSRPPAPAQATGRSFQRLAMEVRRQLQALTGIGEMFDSNEYDLVRIRRAWSRLAGPLAAYSYPERWKKPGQLEITVENSVHAQEISLHARDIIDNLKEAGFLATALITRQGQVPHARPAATVKARAKQAREATPGLDELLNSLKNDRSQ